MRAWYIPIPLDRYSPCGFGGNMNARIRPGPGAAYTSCPLLGRRKRHDIVPSGVLVQMAVTRHQHEHVSFACLRLHVGYIRAILQHGVLVLVAMIGLVLHPHPASLVSSRCLD